MMKKCFLMLVVSFITISLYGMQKTQVPTLKELCIPPVLEIMEKQVDTAIVNEDFAEMQHASARYELNWPSDIVEPLMARSRAPVIAQMLDQQDSLVRVVCFNKQGTMLAVGSNTGQVTIFDLLQGTSKILQGELPYSITALNFSDDGQKIVAGQDNGTIIQWQLPDATAHYWREHTREVTAVYFIDNDQRLLSQGRDLKIIRWELQTGEKTIAATESSVFIVSPDHKYYAESQFLSEPGTPCALKIKCLSTNTVLGEYRLPIREHASHLTFSPDSHSLIIGTDGGHLLVWPFLTVEQPYSIKRGNTKRSKHTKLVATSSFSPHGSSLATGGSDKTLRIGPWQNSPFAKVIKDHLSGIRHIAFSEDSSLIASAGWDNTVCLYDHKHNDTLIAKLPVGYYTSALAFGPNNQTLAIGSDKNILLFTMPPRYLTHIQQLFYIRCLQKLLKLGKNGAPDQGHITIPETKKQVVLKLIKCLQEPAKSFFSNQVAKKTARARIAF